MTLARAALALALSSRVLAAQQEPLPLFRAEAYVVSRVIELHVGGFDGRPVTGLTSADFSAAIDGKFVVAIDMAESRDIPGSYVFSFNPPDGLRDDKTHRIDLRIKSPMNGRWVTLRKLNWQAVFAKPLTPVQN